MKRVCTSISNPTQRGFSLVELLVVVVVLSVLIAMVASSMGGYLDAYRLNHASQQLYTLIEEARSHATTRQRPTAVRFYYLPSPESGAAEVQAIVLLEMDAGGGPPRALTKVTGIARPVQVAESLSSLFSNTSITTGTGPLRERENVPYREFYILPNGKTSLAATSPNPYVTLLLQSDHQSHPANPVVLSIDPVTSSLTLLRR